MKTSHWIELKYIIKWLIMFISKFLQCILMIFFWQNPHFIATIQHSYFLDFFFLFSFSSSLLVLLKEFNQPFSYFKYNFISDELCMDVQSTLKSQNDCVYVCLLILKSLLEQRLFVHSVSLSPSWYLAFSQGCYIFWGWQILGINKFCVY